MSLTGRPDDGKGFFEHCNVCNGVRLCDGGGERGTSSTSQTTVYDNAEI